VTSTTQQQQQQQQQRQCWRLWSGSVRLRADVVPDACAEAVKECALQAHHSCCCVAGKHVHDCAVAAPNTIYTFTPSMKMTLLSNPQSTAQPPGIRAPHPTPPTAPHTTTTPPPHTHPHLVHCQVTPLTEQDLVGWLTGAITTHSAQRIIIVPAAAQGQGSTGRRQLM
jgi:hypothetical protein